MAVIIELPTELEESVRERAQRKGQDVNRFVLQAIEEKISRDHAFEEICAPFACAVEASGITDEEFDRFFEKARSEVWHFHFAPRPEG